MEKASLERLAELLEGNKLLEQLADTLEILNRLAIAGLEANGLAGPKPEIEVDRFVRPSEIPELIGFSYRTFVGSWVPKYGIKYVGEGKARRFRLSEVRRAIEAHEQERGPIPGRAECPQRSPRD